MVAPMVGGNATLSFSESSTVDFRWRLDKPAATCSEPSFGLRQSVGAGLLADPADEEVDKETEGEIDKEETEVVCGECYSGKQISRD
jgi:hypothetical protein